MKDVKSEAVQILRAVQDALHATLGEGNPYLAKLEQLINEDVISGIWPNVVKEMIRHNFKVNTLPRVTDLGNGSLEFQPAFLDRDAQDKSIRIDFEDGEARVSEYMNPVVSFSDFGWQNLHGQNACGQSAGMHSGVY